MNPMLPYEYLLASIGSSPFNSEQVFELGASRSDCARIGFSETIWRTIERDLLQRNSRYILDELLYIRDWFWAEPVNQATSKDSVKLNDSATPRTNLFLWRRLCEKFLNSQGDFALPRYCGLLNQLGKNSSDNDSLGARSHWRWLSFLLPEDSLLIGLWGKNARPTEVRSLPHQLTEVLKRSGFAEIHLHLGASVSFPDIWIGTSRQIGTTSINRSSFQTPCGAFHNGENLADWLIRAMIVRLLLSQFVCEGKHNFDEFLVSALERIVQRRGLWCGQLLNGCVDELIQGKLHSTESRKQDLIFRDLQQLYRQLVVGLHFKSPFVAGFEVEHPSPEILQTWARSESLVGFRRSDPIAAFFQPQQWLSSEMQMVAHCFGHIDTSCAIDCKFEACFWQYFRLRNIFYRHIVHDPTTPGLTSFIRSYNRIYPTLGLMSDRAKFQSAAWISGKDEGLSSLEVRLSPSVNGTNYRAIGREYQQVIRELTTCNSQMSRTSKSLSEIGLVFHFIRSRGRQFEDGYARELGGGTNSDPISNGYRFGRLFKQFRAETQNAIALLQNHPQLLNVIRGVDACNDENAIPLWVVVPHMNDLCNATLAILSMCSSNGHSNLRPLRKTIHVGEDFVHLSTGLRRIGEVLDHLQLGETDRLGHAIALGIQIPRWITQHPVICMSKEDRLWDLIWELELYQRNDIGCDAGRVKYVEYCIAQLSKELLDEKTPDNVIELYQSLYSAERLAAAGFPDGQGRDFSVASVSQLLRRYLTDEIVFARCRSSMTVDVTKECEILERIQSHLRSRVAKRRIIVEVNPSSNLSVANLENLKYHPILRLSGLLPAEDGGVELVIGSDDPSSFATGLPQEYSLLLEALVSAGVTSDLAMNYLKRRAEVSLEARFTAPQVE